MEKMPELKPCRKCKSAPVYRQVGDMKQYWMVICPQCGNHEADHSEASVSKFGARRIWNKRAGEDD